MTDGTTPGPSACWNCRQPLQAGSARCIWCGVPQDAAAPPLVVAPGAALPGSPTAAPTAAPPAVAPTGAAPVVPPRAAPLSRHVDVALSPEFSGVIAATAPRVVAFTIDFVLVAVVVAAAFLISRSVGVTGAVLLEVLLVLWILDARTGATPGMALLQLRTSRADRPVSPGAGASLGRGLVHGAGFLVAGVGAWVVAASSAFDNARRGWADRLTSTVVVAVPAQPRIPLPSVSTIGPPSAGVVTLGAPAVAPPPVAPAGPVLAEPRVVSLAPPRSPVDEESASAAHTGTPSALGAVPQVAGTPSDVRVPDDTLAVGGSVLLVFDTGQRERFAAPVAINLGRNPVASQDGDGLVAVQDPESTVSKTHARLEHSRGTTWITDAGSTNGTEIISDEGVVAVLSPSVPTRLDDGARVRLGKRVFTVSVVLDGDAR